MLVSWSFLLSTVRSGLGQSQPGCVDVHRVLRDPPEPGHAPVPRPLARPGRLAGGAQHGDDSHWQHHGQQRLGGRLGGLQQAGQRQHQVSRLHVWPHEVQQDYRMMQQRRRLLSISRHLLDMDAFQQRGFAQKERSMRSSRGLQVSLCPDEDGFATRNQRGKSIHSVLSNTK